MNIRFTSVAAEEVGPVLGRITIAIQEALQPIFAEDSFGPIDLFMCVVVAVDTLPEGNEIFVRAHDKVGSFTNPFTGERQRYLSVALPFDPAKVGLMSDQEIFHSIYVALVARMQEPKLRIPKSFEYLSFSKKLLAAVALQGV